MVDVRIHDVLAELGLVDDAARRARAILDDARLTNPRKERIALEKLPRVRTAIDERLARFCASCAARTDPGGREIVVVPAAACSAAEDPTTGAR